MYARSTGFPGGGSVLRTGTVDDFSLHDTKLKPRVEQFCKDRVSWLKGGEGIQQEQGNFFDPRKPEFSQWASLLHDSASQGGFVTDE